MHRQLRDSLYKIRFHFWRGPEKALVAQVKKDTNEPCEVHNGAARTISYIAPGYGQLVIHIWVSPDYSLRDSFGLSSLAHEAVHAATFVWERIGAKAPEAGNDEQFAYYVEWIVREFLRRMR